jgi:cytoskeletal protein RodZ
MYGVKRVGLLLLGLVVLVGCRTAHDVAVTSFRVLDAPANYVRRHIDGQTETTTTTTTTATSDSVTTPGRTVTPATTSTQQLTTTTQTGLRSKPSPSPKSSPATVTEKSKPTPSPSRNSSAQSQLPTAKPVPGKQGYVFSPFDPSGGYVDVTGYTSGQKVKDPYSGKIFLVP